MDVKVKKRVEFIRAMETVARHINDERVFEGWLMCGVPDRFIKPTTTDEEIADYFDTDDVKDLTECFLRCMARAKKSGGLCYRD
ncbi:hypothetical protein SELR_pSRC400050 (plasmid) [Selenomonas ruminantium subsp. lactilytica TAM6421]|uniref:Uncharacterized protein n=1 Tax=Selenomonas ruminantium subsp. lactilytica (strain NBRC 103574 / TAM6421) TaxID=927704 RepID=I0GV69_SELRL|nr:hypothetical protein [Selenomonas ruminantium]BAL84656.1 hypothetical protein SELR_pSRC400050 [Selenomonas ruminantium subsp. lactilytica TAM6421]